MTGFLREGNGGKLSMTRVLVAFIVIVQVGVWAFLCCKQGQFLDMPGDNVALIGIAMGAKVWQKGGKEKPVP